MKITPTSHPILWRRLRSWMPEYRKRSASVRIHPSPTTFSDLWSYWDDGSRDEYSFADVSGGPARRIPGNNLASAPPPFGGKPGSFDLRPGVVMLTGGTFLGKPATLHIDILEADARTLGLIDVPETFERIRADSDTGKPIFARVRIQPPNSITPFWAVIEPGRGPIGEGDTKADALRDAKAYLRSYGASGDVPEPDHTIPLDRDGDGFVPLDP